MSAHLERAQLLLAQSRASDAEQEAMLALSSRPDDPSALAVLALSRAAQNKNPAALEAAREAVGLAPDVPYLHYVHAHVQHRGEKHEDAFRAIQEALRLDPHEADFFAELAAIELGRRHWPEALAAAENALALDAEHVGAANLRSMALVQLGRKTEAMETIDFALHRAPENAFSHANQGWNCLHRNDPKRAQEHFREALRLEPDFEYAREGMLEALKARNAIYRGMLAYFLWIGRQSTRFQWAFIIGVYFGTRFARQLSRAQPELNWLWWPLLGLLYAFVYLSWTAQPMFNLLLRFDRFGRHVLSADQRTGSNWFGATLLLTLAALATWLIADGPIGMLETLYLAVLSVCVAATFNRTGRPRFILALCTGLLAAIAAASCFQIYRENPNAIAFASTFAFGFVGFQLLANVLAQK